ncbi:MAG: sulfate adenylyltransferase [Firmicutes bacterium]|nr:sulfate adenylyltransferase [Bacillota bacterium]
MHAPVRELYLSPEASLQIAAHLQDYPHLFLDPMAEADLVQLGIGAYAPLTGFMVREQYRSSLETMRLPDGRLWPIPIALPARAEEVRPLSPDRPVALLDFTGRLRGLMWVQDVWARDPEEEALAVYGTRDLRHPGVAFLFRRPPYYVGGPIRLLAPRPQPQGTTTGAARLPSTPAAVRRRLRELGWSQVAGFQTRNPLHYGHLYLLEEALQNVDGILLHPLVGPTKPDDLPAAVRLEVYRRTVSAYLPSGRVLLALYSGPMRYAGPREAVLHALVRRNFGCTHFLIGRDHAGVGDYYPPDAARELVMAFGRELGITPMPFETAFYCQKCGRSTIAKRCPHPPEDHRPLAGTEVRRRLQRGQPVDDMFPPEIAEILRTYYNASALGEDREAKSQASNPPAAVPGRATTSH